MFISWFAMITLGVITGVYAEIRAYYGWKKGVVEGAEATLDILKEKEVIHIGDNGEVYRFIDKPADA